MQFSDAVAFARGLAQVLSVEKLPIGLLLGAGCPVSIRVPVIPEAESEPILVPLIPDVEGLTTLVAAELGASSELAQPFSKILSALNDDGIPTPNIEQILGFVRTLISAAGVGVVRGLDASVLVKIDQEICQSIFEKVNKRLPSAESGYRSIARYAGGRRRNPIEVFTTNYDLLMEQAFEEARVPYFDGFVGSFSPFFDLTAIEQDELPARWGRLWKLHGSINWRKGRDPSRVCREFGPDSQGELLIHPSHQKFDDSRRMPYLAFIDRLRTFVRNARQPVVLLVIGYSFKDEHINAAIEESLRANPHSTCYAVQFADLEQYPDARRISERCSNLTIWARDCEFSSGRAKLWHVTQSPLNAALAGVFDWSAGDLESAGTGVPAQLLLGDFARFGEFLDSVAGYPRAEAEGAAK